MKIAISSCYQACKDYMFYESLRDNKRAGMFKNCISQFAVSYSCGKAIERVSSLIASTYRDEWFSYPWQKEQAIKDDTFKFKRLANWLGSKKVVAVEKPITAPLGDSFLEGKTNLVVLDEKGYMALNIFNRKPDKSYGGKDYRTNIKYDLQALVSKYSLEPIYPNVRIANVYLSSPDDSPGNMLNDFVVDKTRKSNVFLLDFEEYYEKGTFLKSKLLDVISQVAHTISKVNCFGCPHEALCKCKVLSEDNTEDSDMPMRTYVVPTFTQSQKAVVSHINGPMLVLAGPGSGKTAALVGRIKNMMEYGIDSDYILAITFTRDAANELEERIKSFTKDVPNCSTIHALCYGILRNNKGMLGKEIKLLGQKEKMSLISDMLAVFPPLKGFSYENLNGQNGLLRTVERKLDKYLVKCKGNKEKFLVEERGMFEDFFTFADTYQGTMSTRGYISFDEQISLCVEFLKSHPDILNMYQDIYRYIMVDEFQDIDSSQAEFIYLLANKFNNLVVVGDDDQNIYGFRGGTNRYMLEFSKSFPGAKTIVFNENFRSDSRLVELSQSVIRKNQSRLDKQVVATRKGNCKPVFLNSESAETIDMVVDKLLSKGYDLKDIAILASKNATLERINKETKATTILEKTLLREDAFFGVVKDVLSLYKSNLKDNYSFYHLLRSFGVDVRPGRMDVYEHLLNMGYPPIRSDGYLKENIKDLIYCGLRLIYQVFAAIEAGHIEPAFLIANIALILNKGQSPALLKLQEIVSDNNITTLSSCLEYMENMVLYEDDARVDVSDVPAIHLITSHDSKGREFNNVIIVDDFSEEETEEGRRLLYVAMTRAKDNLCILSQKNLYGLRKEAV